jgi:hypothetical protein
MYNFALEPRLLLKESGSPSLAAEGFGRAYADDSIMGHGRTDQPIELHMYNFALEDPR